MERKKASDMTGDCSQWRGQVRRGCADSRRHLRDDAAQRCLGQAGGEGDSSGLRSRSRAAQNPLHVPNFSRRGHHRARSRNCRCGAGGRDQHRRNGNAVAQERRRLERRASLPSEVSRGAPAGRHEDHGWRCLRGAPVYAGGGNIVDFLALAGVDTAKAICAVRDEFRRGGTELPRLAFADIMVPHQGPAAQAVEVALRMLEAGVDAVGVHLQSDARRADPDAIERDYLGDVARAVFERVGRAAPVQVVGGLSVAQAKSLAQAGLRAFVISGNLGQPDGRARYDLPRDQIERYVADTFIAAVSSA